MGVVTFKSKLSDFNQDQYLRFDIDYIVFNKNIRKRDRFLKDYVKTIETGQPISKEDYSENGDPTEFIHLVVRNIKNGELSLENPIFINEEKGEKLKSFKIVKGDIIIAISANCGATFYFDEIITEYQLTLSHYLAKFKVNEELINPRLLVYYLNSSSLKKYFRATETGKTQKNLSKTYLRELPILLPKSIIEQNELLQLIQPIETEITYLKNSKQKPLDIINKVFGNEFGFDWEMYKDFGKGMTAGTQQSNIKEKLVYKVAFSQIQKSNIVRVSSRFHNPKTQFLNEILFSKPNIKVKDIVAEKVHRGASPEYDQEGDIPVVKTAHLKNGTINISEDEFVSLETYKKSIRSQIFENDVLIASTGKVSLGRIDIVETDQELVVDGHISIMRVNPKKYNPQFLTYFLRSILGVFQIERDYTGATNQIELYSSEIENFDIPNFSFEKQTAIVEKIKSQIDAQNSIDHQIEQKQLQINQIIENAIKTE
jgi:type I restriction enzyme, S subunit